MINHFIKSAAYIRSMAIHGSCMRCENNNLADFFPLKWSSRERDDGCVVWNQNILSTMTDAVKFLKIRYTLIIYFQTYIKLFNVDR